MTDQPHDVPVTRREFNDALDKLASRVEELFRAKQVSWPLILTAFGILLGLVGALINNMVDVATTKTIATASADSLQEIRERTRGLEANLKAVMIEGESQNRWIADAINLENQHTLQLMRAHHPDIPDRSYWPLGKIGDADVTNGKH